MDPDEGWHGLGTAPVPRSPEVPRQQQQQWQRQQQRRLSAASPSLSGWAQVPVSPPAAEYPAMMANAHSPPHSPSSVRSVSSAGSSGSGTRAAAGEGLVALARDQNENSERASPNANVTLMDVSNVAPSSSSSLPPAAGGGGGPRGGVGIAPRSLPFETFEALETQDHDQGSGRRGAWAGGARAAQVLGGGERGVGCTTVDDVNAMEMDLSHFGNVNPGGEHEHAFVMRAAPGMTTAEAVQAIAEAAEIRGITPTSVVLSRTQVSPSRLSNGGAPSSLAREGKENEGHAQEMMFRHGHDHSPAGSYRSMTPPGNSSPSRDRAAAAASAGVAGVPDVDVAGLTGTRVR